MIAELQISPITAYFTTGTRGCIKIDLEWELPQQNNIKYEF
jgi:hypothetical protein